VIGSTAIGFWIAHAAFWILLAVGAAELGIRRAGIFLALWGIGYVGSAGLPSPSSLFMSYVALLDVALVFIVFKGDVRLT
jgi:hypothetical protein